MIETSKDPQVRAQILERQRIHYRVTWVYQGLSQDIPEMYDKPYALCKWWVREHKYDHQYARGKFLILSLVLPVNSN